MMGAYFTAESGAKIEIIGGWESSAGWPEKDTAIDFFADPVPQPPLYVRRGTKRHTDWRAEYAEW